MIELWYIDDCPSHERFLPHLRALLDAAGVDEAIHERRVVSDDDARAQRFLGSPTLRVDGVDVDPAANQRADYAMQCRLYPSGGGLRGTPPDEWILAALRRGRPETPR